MSIQGHLIPINMTDLKKIREVINKLEEYEGDNSNALLKKFRQLESERKLFSAEEYKTRFEALGKNATRENLAEAIKEALTTMPGGYSTNAFIRKLVNLLLVKYGHKPQKSAHYPIKTRTLLQEIGIDF